MSKIFSQVSPKAEPSVGCKRKKKWFEALGSTTCWKVIEVGGIDDYHNIFPWKNWDRFYSEISKEQMKDGSMSDKDRIDTQGRTTSIKV